MKKKPMHRMPNGKMMEGARHEKTEGKRERLAEYGKKGKKKKK